MSVVKTLKKLTRKEFNADVMAEINALKKYATKKEIALLNFKHFDNDSMYNCIYGQMTGVCTSDRAHKLMDKSCQRVMNTKDGSCDIIGDTFTKVNNSGKINGKYTGQSWDKGGFRDWSYLSALEGYILLKGAKNKKIIEYLKGERDTLSL